MPDISDNQTIYLVGTGLDSFFDNFNDNSQNTILWDKDSFLTNNQSVTVSESNYKLTITPLSSTAGVNYNGYLSKTLYNFTDEEIFIKVLEVTQGTADTQLIIGSDNNNCIKFEYENDLLYFTRVIGGTPSQTSLTYNSTDHLWWRIRHTSDDDTFRWDTSPDGVVWTQRRTLSRSTLTITATKVNISAGTYESVSTPGQAVFDNFHWHPRIPGKYSWSDKTFAITANETLGNWDYLLYGTGNPFSIVKFKGKYFLYYGGASDDDGDPLNRAVGVATSEDGINFTKYPDNPIITYGAPDTEEGVASGTCIIVNNVIHMWYGAIRSTGGSEVDIDVRYRKSIDGYNFTDDTLIFASAGNEYSPLWATYDGTTWSVYIKGPLTAGKGAIRRLSGSSPTNLPNNDLVTSTTFGWGGTADYISSTRYIVHMDFRVSGRDRYQIRTIDYTSPNTISEPIFFYQFEDYSDYPMAIGFRDPQVGKWFLYKLDLVTPLYPNHISVRTADINDITNNQPIYISGKEIAQPSIKWAEFEIPAATEISDNQPIYLVGKDILSDNQTIYTRGKDSLAQGQATFTQAKAQEEKNQPVYLKGQAETSNNQEIYLIGQTTTSDNQAIFLQAVAGATNNQSIYLKGSSTALNNQEIYLSGQAVESDNQAIFLQGVEGISDNQPIYLVGISTISDSQEIFLSGQDLEVNSQPCYLVGVDSLSDNQNIFLVGKQEISDNQPVYLVGQASQTANQPIYLYGQAEATNSQDIYLKGSDTISDNQSIFTLGGIVVTDNQNIYLKGEDSISDNLPIYVNVEGSIEDNQPIYLAGISTTQDNQSIYLTGKVEISDNQSIYLEGVTGQPAISWAELGIPSPTIVASQSIYLEGASQQVSDNQPIYLVGKIEIQASQGIFTKGQAALQNNQPTYSVGKDVAVQAQPIYLVGEAGIQANQPIYLVGGIVVQNNQTIYLHGQNSAIDSQSIYLVSGNLASDNQPIYLKGVDTSVDNQPIYLVGKDSINNNQAIYLIGRDTITDNQPIYLTGAGNVISDNQVIYLSGKSTLQDSIPV